MDDDLANHAFEDLDQIAIEAGQALNALAKDDVESAQDILQDIQTRAEVWEDGGHSSRNLDSLIKQLEGTEWSDTYKTTKGPLKITSVKPIQSEPNYEYLSVRLQRENHEDRPMVGHDFLDYIAYERFIPQNYEAKTLNQTIQQSSQFPTL